MILVNLSENQPGYSELIHYLKTRGIKYNVIPPSMYEMPAGYEPVDKLIRGRMANMTPEKKKELQEKYDWLNHPYTNP